MCLLAVLLIVIGIVVLGAGLVAVFDPKSYEYPSQKNKYRYDWNKFPSRRSGGNKRSDATVVFWLLMTLAIAGALVGTGIAILPDDCQLPQVRHT